MKIEKITENKIRIILNLDDLAKKNIDVHSIIKNTDVAQKLFKKILKQAEKEVGFDVSNSKLLIEAFVSSEGFFVLTFTKLGIDENFKSSQVKKPKVKRKSTDCFSKTAIYQFDSFEEFCSFCTYLNNSCLGNLHGFAKSVVFYEYCSNYFLAFSGINVDFKNINLFYTSISEFAKLVSNSSAFSSKLLEYGHVVLKNNAIKNGINFCADA